MSDVLSRYPEALEELRPAIEEALRPRPDEERRTIEGNVLELVFDYASQRVVIGDVLDAGPGGEQELGFDELRAILAKR